MNLPYKFISFLFFTSIYLGCFPTLAQNQSNTSWQINKFKKQDAVNPILSPDLKQQFFCPIQGKTVGWENKNVLNPTALLKDGKVHLLYRAQDSLGTSRIGLAISEDGIHFKKMPKPILFPEQDAFKKYEWPGGIEDPRIVQTEDGNYLITYTSYDGKTARLCFATSPNLLHWKKMGPMLKDPKYIDLWSKSGAIVVKQVGSKMIATKINGYYWMYFGDTDLFMAQSKDLIQWNVLEDAENKQRISVLQPRKGYFDSRLVEPGPYALMQKSGILLIYNSSNAANFNDTKLSKFTYSAAQALFHLERPYQLIQRSNKPFIWPNKVYEQIGEVNEVCFVEGLVPFKSRWFLYYGTADSKIAVATSPQR
ncbi:glycoside hydrolase family 130 protein [Aquirufa aurantiipilula]